MTELDEATTLANKVLDRVSADPDDDLAILARQFLRARERELGAANIAIRTLAEAVLKFAPDLANELKRRWEQAKSESDERLNAFLALLRRDC